MSWGGSLIIVSLIEYPAKFFSLLKIGKYGEDTKHGIIYND